MAAVGADACGHRCRPGNGEGAVLHGPGRRPLGHWRHAGAAQRGHARSAAGPGARQRRFAGKAIRSQRQPWRAQSYASQPPAVALVAACPRRALADRLAAATLHEAAHPHVADADHHPGPGTRAFAAPRTRWRGAVGAAAVGRGDGAVRRGDRARARPAPGRRRPSGPASTRPGSKYTTTWKTTASAARRTSRRERSYTVSPAELRLPQAPLDALGRVALARGTRQLRGEHRRTCQPSALTLRRYAGLSPRQLACAPAGGRGSSRHRSCRRCGSRPGTRWTCSAGSRWPHPGCRITCFGGAQAHAGRTATGAP